MAQPQPYGYYGSEAEQYTFYRLPKALFTNSRFTRITLSLISPIASSNLSVVIKSVPFFRF